MSSSALAKPARGYLPIAMSIAALAVVLVHVALFGTGREADEGTAAHIFPLLMAAQIPITASFALTWLPRRPRAALKILGLQAMAALAALAPVFFLNL